MHPQKLQIKTCNKPIITYFTVLSIIISFLLIFYRLYYSLFSWYPFDSVKMHLSPHQPGFQRFAIYINQVIATIITNASISNASDFTSLLIQQTELSPNDLVVKCLMRINSIQNSIKIFFFPILLFVSIFLPVSLYSA